MVVIVLEVCPSALRGDLSKWLIEISTGVYCGNLNSRVREALWDRICDNCKNGRATMVYSSVGEQNLDFRIHNSSWEAIDYDGIKLIKYPSAKKLLEKHETVQSVQEKAIRYAGKSSLKIENNYTVVDIETTGLNTVRDDILEIGALHVRDDIVTDTFSMLVIRDQVPQKIRELTGITPELLRSDGKPLPEVLRSFISFVGDDQIVGFNVKFDLNFIMYRIEKCHLTRKVWKNTIDIMPLAHQLIDDVENYKLETLTSYLKVNHVPMHRALPDCYAALDVLLKLKEKLKNPQ